MTNQSSPSAAGEFPTSLARRRSPSGLLPNRRQHTNNGRRLTDDEFLSEMHMGHLMAVGYEKPQDHDDKIFNESGAMIDRARYLKEHETDNE